MLNRGIAIGFGAVITVSLVASSCAIIADLNHIYERDEGAGGGVVGYTWAPGDPTKGPGGAGGGGPCAMYAYKLPEWLKFESPTAGRSTQISDDSLCVGFNANEARARNIFPKGMEKWGLSIESSRTNSVLQSDSWNIMVNAFGWFSSKADPSMDLKLTTNQAGPNVSGPANASMFSSTMFPPASGQHSIYFLVDARVVSTWVRGEGGASAGCINPQDMTQELCYAHFKHKNVSERYVNVKSNKWHRVSITNPQSESDALVLETRDEPAGSGSIVPPVSVVAYGAQAEQAAYPSSYISTGDTTITRAAEKLYSNDREKLLPNGYFKLTMKIAPNFAMVEAVDEMSVSEYHLLFLETKNRLFLDRDDRKLYLEIEGGQVASDALSFSREQELTITVENQQGMPMTLTVAGAKEGNGTFIGGPAKAVATSKTVYILGTDTGAEECSDLRFIQFE
jgi:hypothetical protein